MSMNLASLCINPKYMGPSAWWQHVPIAHWLVSELKPNKVVELGSHYGVSFFAFCEAAELVSPDTFVYAIDTWQGDEHAGNYDESVHSIVSSYYERYHRRRSSMIRSTFDEAVKYFENNSIDILHIDGLHTYEAVKHDYETWIPKMKNESVILFHDINVREREFGVWKLWEELKPGNTYHEIHNGHGLGILIFGDKTSMKLKGFANISCFLTSKGELLEKLAQLSPGGSFGSSPLAKAEADAHRAKIEARYAKDELEAIHSSTSWRAIKIFQKLKDRLMRNESIQ